MLMVTNKQRLLGLVGCLTIVSGAWCFDSSNRLKLSEEHAVVEKQTPSLPKIILASEDVGAYLKEDRICEKEDVAVTYSDSYFTPGDILAGPLCASNLIARYFNEEASRLSQEMSESLLSNDLDKIYTTLPHVRVRSEGLLRTTMDILDRITYTSFYHYYTQHPDELSTRTDLDPVHKQEQYMKKLELNVDGTRFAIAGFYGTTLNDYYKDVEHRRDTLLQQ